MIASKPQSSASPNRSKWRARRKCMRAVRAGAIDGFSQR
jgi:hypothetical protein